MADPVEAALRTALRDVEAAIVAMLRAAARRSDQLGDAAQRDLAAALTRSSVLADLSARSATWARYDRAQYAAIPESVPYLEFPEALADLLSREPRLAASAAEVARVYATYYTTGRGFAAVRSARIETTMRVQDIVSSGLIGGTAADVERAIEGLTGWTRGYSETVAVTNLATAYSAGKVQQGLDPDIEEELPAWKFVTAGDVDVRATARENHAAANGLVAGKRDPIWQRATPPCGYG